MALLHLWTLVKNASGYNACVGTVFNCPGAYDGTQAYTTSDVVEIQVCMCACVHVCVCACAYLHVHVNICMCMCMRISTADLDLDRHPGPQVLPH